MLMNPTFGRVHHYPFHIILQVEMVKKEYYIKKLSEEASWSCPFTNINVTNAGTFLSSWYFPAMGSKHIAVLAAGTTTRASSCLLFVADHPTRLHWEVEGRHHPVPRPQGVSPEVDLYGREPFKKSRLNNSDYSKPSAGWPLSCHETLSARQQEDLIMSIFWFLLAIGIWITLQVYVLPKFGISTWMKPNCQLGNEEEHTQVTKDNFRS